MPVTPPTRRRSAALLCLLLLLAACGGATGTTTPATATGVPPVPGPAQATGTGGATAATAGGGATTTATTTVPPRETPATPTTTRAAMPVATAVRATTPATPAPTRTAPPVPTAAATPSPRGYAPDDPCAPFAGGAAPPPVAAPPAPPARLCIPALLVSAPVVPVGVRPDGAMDEPGDLRTVGWYAPGPPPGATGNAVIDGKLDGEPGPDGDRRGVFFDLSLLRPGDLVVVLDAAGVARRFRVYDVRAYREADAPLTQIFGDAPDANLNLITAAGSFDRARGRYESNLVAVAPRAP